MKFIQKLKQRKLLRLAEKQRKFEARREKEKNKNRLRKYVICGIFASLNLIAAAFCLSCLMPMYADYKYQTTKNTLLLPEITEPCLVEVQINYQGERPSDIKITENNMTVPNLVIEEFPDEKYVILSFDTRHLSDKYYLTLKPQDNLNLTYDIRKLPSRRHIVYDTEFYTDAQKDLWVQFSSAYPRLDDPTNVVIKFIGKKHPYIYDFNTLQHEIYNINVFELARIQGLDPSEYKAVEVIIGILKDKTKEIVPSVSSTIFLDKLPEYDTEHHHDFKLDQTLDYIDTLDLPDNLPTTKKPINEPVQTTITTVESKPVTTAKPKPVETKPVETTIVTTVTTAVTTTETSETEQTGTIIIEEIIEDDAQDETTTKKKKPAQTTVTTKKKKTETTTEEPSDEWLSEDMYG